MYGIYEATGALRFETRQATVWIFIWCLQVITVITPSVQNKKNIYIETTQLTWLSFSQQFTTMTQFGQSNIKLKPSKFPNRLR